MIHNIDPVIFSIGPLAVRYYGLIYISGFIIGYYFLSWAMKKGKLPGLEKKDLDDFIFYSIICVVTGARLFEVIFYEPSYYIKNPLKIFAVWEGGLSFHGGIFGVLVASWIFCRKKKISLLKWGDMLTFPAALALFLGRIANFINGELFGKAVDNQVNPPWYAVKFIRTDSAQLWRIPTQILESFKNLLIFILLWIIWKKAKKLKDGFLIWFFCIFYGFFRFFIEIFKDVYQDQFLGMSTGQLLCIPMILIGLIGFYYNYKKKA